MSSPVILEGILPIPDGVVEFPGIVNVKSILQVTPNVGNVIAQTTTTGFPVFVIQWCEYLPIEIGNQCIPDSCYYVLIFPI